MESKNGTKKGRTPLDPYYQAKVLGGLIERVKGPASTPKLKRRKKSRKRLYCAACMIRVSKWDWTCPRCSAATVLARGLPPGTHCEALPLQKRGKPNQAEERRRQYDLYINKSPDWQRLRREVIERDHGKCQQCGSPGSDVHHLTYRRLFHENLEDLLLLCRVCHNSRHQHRVAS